MKAFGDFAPTERRDYITLLTGEYYPDILEDACHLYMPVLETFSQLLRRSESSTALFLNIADTPNQWMRTQLCRVFRKYGLNYYITHKDILNFLIYFVDIVDALENLCYNLF